MAMEPHGLGLFAGEDVGEMAEEEAARRAQDRRHRLLRVDRSIDQPHAALTDVAMAAFANLFTEEPEQDLASATGGFAEGDKIVELFALDALSLIRGVALVDLPATQGNVAGAIESERIGRQAVPARAADLLIVRLDRRGQIGVKNKAHVRLVDPPAEGNGGEDDDSGLSQERVLIDASGVPLHARMVRKRAPAVAGKLLRQLLGATPRGAIDDAALAFVLLQSIDELARRVGLGAHCEEQIGPVE